MMSRDSLALERKESGIEFSNVGLVNFRCKLRRV